MSDSESIEEALEAAFWEFDAARKAHPMPMAERDAFKSAVRNFADALSVPCPICGSTSIADEDTDESR